MSEVKKMTVSNSSKGMNGTYVRVEDYITLKAERDMYRNAEISWEKAMMSAIGEDGTGSVTKAISDIKAERDALAAENLALKNAMMVTLEHVDVMDSGAAGVVAMIAFDALHSNKTPATDAYANQLRAEGARACGVHLREWYDYQVEQRSEAFAANLLKENGND